MLPFLLKFQLALAASVPSLCATARVMGWTRQGQQPRAPAASPWAQEGRRRGLPAHSVPVLSIRLRLLTAFSWKCMNVLPGAEGSILESAVAGAERQMEVEQGTAPPASGTSAPAKACPGSQGPRTGRCPCSRKPLQPVTPPIPRPG